MQPLLTAVVVMVLAGVQTPPPSPPPAPLTPQERFDECFNFGDCDDTNVDSVIDFTPHIATRVDSDD